MDKACFFMWGFHSEHECDEHEIFDDFVIHYCYCGAEVKEDIGNV